MAKSFIPNPLRAWVANVTRAFSQALRGERQGVSSRWLPLHRAPRRVELAHRVRTAARIVRSRRTTLSGREMRLLSLSARALLIAALPFPLLAQSAQKKALTQADWDRWRSITNPTLSNDGKWAAYTLTPQVGDGEFVVHATSGTTEYS